MAGKTRKYQREKAAKTGDAIIKKEGSDEEIIQWCVDNLCPPTPATQPDIVKYWICGGARARKLYREADRRIREHWSGSKEMPRPDHVEISRYGDSMRTVFTATTKKGEDLPIEKAIQNPKLQSALRASEIVLEDFEIKSFKANSWDVVLKIKKDGKEKAEQHTNHQFSIEWTRRKPQPLLLAMERLVKLLPKDKAPRAKKSKRKGDIMVEIAMYDVHFGLLAWAAETGNDYDIHIARKVMNDGTAQILKRTAGMSVQEFLLPIGNDFLHINNIVGQTPQNRHVLDTDTRFARIIEEGCLALRDTINALREKAPVKVIWVPGNHDPQTSFFLLHILAAWYRMDGNVEVDTSPKPRKIVQYGCNVIGFLHGCDIAQSKHKALGGLLADEAADIWGPGQYREIHMGHRHIKGELYFTAVSTEGGVVVRNIPSLAGTDYWHFSKGFVGTSKTCQMFIWNENYGLESVHDIHVDKSLYIDTNQPKGI